MNKLYERIAVLCSQRGIKPGRMCSDLGISRGNITDLKMGRIESLSSDSLSKIAKYFSVTTDYLLGTEQKETAPTLTKKDERDIEKRLEAVLEDLENAQGGLAFSGEPLDEVTRELLAESLRNSMRIGKTLAKQKFTPKKYRKD